MNIQPLIKVYKSIYPDLKSFSKKEILITCLIFLLMLIISIFNMNKKKNMKEWQRVIILLSGLTSFMGFLTSLLLSKSKFSAYFFGILFDILYGIYSFAYGYSGDAQIFIIFFLPMQFYGIYEWNKNTDIKKLTIKQDILLILFLGMLIVGFYYEIPEFSKSITNEYIYSNNKIARLFDSIATSLTIIAQLLIINRYIETWFFWITSDLFRIAMYSGISGYGVSLNILIMLCVFITNSCFGIKYWYYVYKQQKMIDVVV